LAYLFHFEKRPPYAILNLLKAKTAEASEILALGAGL
jgi:hypothetical protein